MTINQQRKRRQKFSPNKETRREPENPRGNGSLTSFSSTTIVHASFGLLSLYQIDFEPLQRHVIYKLRTFYVIV